MEIPVLEAMERVTRERSYAPEEAALLPGLGLVSSETSRALRVWNLEKHRCTGFVPPSGEFQDDPTARWEDHPAPRRPESRVSGSGTAETSVRWYGEPEENPDSAQDVDLGLGGLFPLAPEAPNEPPALSRWTSEVHRAMWHTEAPPPHVRTLIDADDLVVISTPEHQVVFLHPATQVD